MTRDLFLKLLILILGIVALLAMGACAAAGSPQPAANPAQSEPTAIPTSTPVAEMETATPTPVSQSESNSPESTPTPEPADDSAEVADEGSESEADTEAAEEEESTGAGATTEESPGPGNPVQIRIDSIGVVAPFEYVGVDEKGNMDAPEGWDNVAWYEPGTVPGAQGNSVVAGHYDRPGGGRAIFFDLNHLAPGDRITVVTENDEELVFEITEVEVVSAENAPLEKIFGSSDQHNLNLITCNGVWDTEAGMYNERLVVYSTLVSA